ncbi:MAG: DNA-processing protein DprA [Muribaculaceae bacterium]|nr:DNA-processing protein DprA [Muribaculaceae bacterium]
MTTEKTDSACQYSDPDMMNVALAMTKGVTTAIVRRMREFDVTIEEFFTLDNRALGEALHLNGTATIDRYERDKALFAARKEIEFMGKSGIRPLMIGEKGYPVRLAECEDAPILLYQLGECDLNAEHMLSVVGTRRITPYGADAERRILTDLSGYYPDMCVVSGLAYGADAVAHSTAFDNGLPTVAVVAHGLNMIYPAAHRDLARRIVKSGGAILTEYPHGTTPYRGNFLARNRIVAWMSDATLLVESEIKGGAMSTARHAFNENREVYAIPGRITDPVSAGCNHLIRTNRAHLLTSAADIAETIGWRTLGLRLDAEPRSIFPELDGDVAIVYRTLLSADRPMTADELHAITLIPIPQLMSLLPEMEFDDLLLRHPGNRFSAIG